MNMQEGDRDVSLVVTWEYVPQPPEDFQHVQPYWFDVTGCGNSEVPAQPDAVFSFSSNPVKAPTSGVGKCGFESRLPYLERRQRLATQRDR